MARSDPLASGNSIYIFLFTAVIIALTIFSLEMKVQPKEVYVITKSIESLFKSTGLQQQYDPNNTNHG